MKIAFKGHMDGGNPSYEVEGPWSMAHMTIRWVHNMATSLLGGAYSNRAREDTWKATSHQIHGKMSPYLAASMGN